MITAPPKLTREFAALHQRGRPFVLPNAWDVASALLLAEAGFPAVGTTSLGVNAAAGIIDGSGTGRACTVALAAAIVPRLAIPVTVDLEGGYSDDPAAVAELAAELASLGVAGINLEDAGTGGGLRSARDQVAILRAVVAAAPGLFVNARTDTYWLRAGPEGGRLAETVSRLLQYQAAGARGVFVPAVTEMAAIETITSQVRIPLNVLWRPNLDMAQLAGAAVARVSTGSAPYRRALAAGLATAVAARDDGRPPDPEVGYDRVVALVAAGAGRAPSDEPRAPQSTPLSSA